MDAHIDIDIEAEASPAPSEQQLRQWLQDILLFAQAKSLAQMPDKPEISLLICSTATITELNANYRNKPNATNVLSFPADLDPQLGIGLMGDIILCSEVINREANDQHKNIADHWLHMLVHSCLHLMGFDHIAPDEADIMEALEIEFLAKHDINNPYFVTIETKP